MTGCEMRWDLNIMYGLVMLSCQVNTSSKSLRPCLVWWNEGGNKMTTFFGFPLHFHSIPSFVPTYQASEWNGNMTQFLSYFILSSFSCFIITPLNPLNILFLNLGSSQAGQRECYLFFRFHMGTTIVILELVNYIAWKEWL